MSLKRRWTPEEDAELLDTVSIFLGDGNFIKDAFAFYAEDQGRTYQAVRRRYFDIKGEDAPDLRLREPGVNPPKPKEKKQPAPKLDIHLSLEGISNYIDELEQANEFLRHQVDALNARIAGMENIESEFNHLLTIINRSRKEAFAGDAAPKQYKIIDGTPVFK